MIYLTNNLQISSHEILIIKMLTFGLEVKSYGFISISVSLGYLSLNHFSKTGRFALISYQVTISVLFGYCLALIEICQPGLNQ